MNDILSVLKDSITNRSVELALVDNDASYTYEQTDTLSDSVVRQLLKAGIKRGDYVGLSFDKCAAHVISAIACLKLGCIATFLSPSYKPERVKMIADNCKLALILTAEQTCEVVNAQAGDVPVICADLSAENDGALFEPPRFSGDDPAFAFYTSGSTGKPKGVLIPRRAIVSMALEYNSRAGIRENMHQAVVPPFMFVISLCSIFSALTSGATLYIPDMQTALNPALLYEYCKKNKIQHITLPVRLGVALLTDFGPADIESIGLGGEAMTDMPNLPVHVKLMNGYGMTETCASSINSEFFSDDIPAEIPIGKPFGRMDAYILDSALAQVPDGEEGELCLSGPQVALGYIGLPELTAKTFVANPWAQDDEHSVLLRTGDLARRGADGNIYYIGRKDNMVNLHGYRIEPEEVEQAIMKYPGVRSAVVALKNVAGTDHLCMYYTSAMDLDAKDMKAHLLRTLPAYMCPSYIVRLGALPLGPSGKVDRHNLPEIAVSAGKYVAPVTDEEKIVAQAFAAALGYERVSADDNFFDIGGHSLRAMKVANDLLEQTGTLLSVKDIFDNPTARKLAAVLAQSKARKGARIPKADPADCYPMSSTQRRVYYMEQIGERNTAYNVPRVFHISGAVDVTRLEDAFKKLVAHNRVLRTCFDPVNGEVMQIIKANVEFELPVVRLPQGTDIKEEMRRFVRPFDLSIAPLMRAEIVTSENDKYLLLDIHHSVFDGGSVGPFIRQLTAFYSGESLPENELDYADYSQWMSARDLSAQGEYWRGRFKGGIPTLDMPLDMPRPAQTSAKGGRVCAHLNAETMGQFDALRRATGATDAMLLITGFMATLARHADKEELTVGSVISGRVHRDVEDMIGMFVNTVALYGAPESGKTFREFLTEVRASSLDAYENQEYPLDMLADDLHIARDMSRNPFFDAMFVLQASEHLQWRIGDAMLTMLGIEEPDAQCDLSLEAIPESGGYLLNLDYSAELFHRESVEYILNHMLTLLSSAAQQPDEKLGDISMMAPGEAALLEKYNHTEVPYDKSRTIPARFEEQAKAVPEHIAVVAKDRRISYAELERITRNLAGYVAGKGIGREDVVAILVNYDEYMPISALGVARSGAAYQPLDPGYPAERISFMLEDAGAKLLIADESLLPLASGFDGDVLLTKDIEKLPKFEGSLPAPNAEDLFVILYTSGSTGVPKGVLLSHGNVLCSLLHYMKVMGIGPDDRFGQYASFGFDAHMCGLYGSLMSGGTVVIVPGESRLDMAEASLLFEREHVTLTDMTTQLGREFALKYDRPELRNVMLGGERLMPTALPKYTKLINAYGPTETSIQVTTEVVEGEYSIVPIGRANDNVKIYIVDANGQRCPVNVPGEILVAGAFVTRGYLNRPKETAASFTPNPFAEPGYERVYHTGDIARITPNGKYDFIGRNDGQVKVRGYRIELSEVESCISQYPGISGVAVVAFDEPDGGKYLAAYVVAETPVDEAALAEFIKARKPSYMVPAIVMQIDRIPINRNGKVDKRALPVPEPKDAAREYVAPETPAEKAVVAAFEKVLSREKISVTGDFFELGGHSLRAIRLINELEQSAGVRVKIADLFRYPTPRQLAKLIENTTESEQSIPVAAELPEYPMSSTQRRMFVLSQMDAGSVAYNMAEALEIAGEFDAARLENAVRALIDRHEILRTRFTLGNNGEPVQRILDHMDFNISSRHAEPGETLNEALRSFIRPFDLQNPPLLRIGLLYLDGKTYLLFDMHHIVSDGMSTGIFMRELSALYAGEELPPARQYKDYSQWICDRDLSAQRDYWAGVFSDEIPLLDLPLDFTRPSKQSFAGGYVSQKINASGIKALSASAGATDYMILLSAFMCMLARYTYQDDIIVGSGISARTHRDTESMMGMFVNTLAMRGHPTRDKTFRAFLDEMRQFCIRAYANQDYPFDDLVETIHVARDPSRNPVFDVMFVVQNNEQEDMRLGSTPLIEQRQDDTICKFDLSLEATPMGDEYALRLEYCAALFTKESAQSMLAHIVAITEAATETPDTPLGLFNMLGDGERELLNGFNQTQVPYDMTLTVPAMFARQARQTPDNQAVIMRGGSFTYAWLEDSTRRLAGYMRHIGIGRGDVVSILLPRNENMAVCSLAVLRAGATYEPLDPSYPRERIAYMMRDANCKLLLLDESFSDLVTDYTGTIFLTRDIQGLPEYDDELPETDPNDLMALIYTSGSTGVPKGTMLTHGGVMCFLQWYLRYYGVTERDRVAAYASFGFDACIMDLFAPLIAGAATCIVDSEIRLDMARLKAFYEDNNITLSFLTTQLGREFALHYAPNSLRHLTIGGEVLVPLEPPKGFTLHNAYGPTETSIFTTTFKIDRRYDIVPIGAPLDNLKIHILDPDGNLCGVGVPGEMAIAGTHVCLGYLNLPEQTAKSFTLNPFDHENGYERMYRTGDIARWLPSGNVDFVGRKDGQVKIRGFRVELAEVEAVIREFPGVESATVVAFDEEGGGKYIAAYVTGKAALDLSSLEEFVRARKPHYMVPASIMQIDEIPLNQNQKVSKRALPKPAPKERIAYVAPSTETEKVICDIFAEVTGQDKVGVNDDFFEIGGHSLRAIKVVNAIDERTGRRLQVSDIFRDTTPAKLALLLDKACDGDAAYHPIPLAPAQASYPMSSTQRRVYLIEQMDDYGTAYNMPAGFRVEGELDAARLTDAIRRIIERNEVLRTGFVMENGQPMQRIAEHVQFDVPTRDALPGETHDEMLAKFTRPFDLSKPPLIRMELVREVGETTLLFDMHHIVSDGMSIDILFKQIASLYAGEELPTPRAQYKDYSEWMRGRDLSKQRDYWLGEFSGEIPLLDMPLDFSRKQKQSFRGGRVARDIDGAALRTFARNNDATDFIVMLAALMALLARYARQDDIVVGSPISARTHRDTENMMGMFVNTLALRARPDGEKTFAQFVAEVRGVCLNAYENQDYPFEELVEAVKVNRDQSRNPLFDVLFVLQNNDQPVMSFGDAALQRWPDAEGVCKFDLNLEAVPSEDGYSLGLDYCADLFSRESAQYILKHFVILLEVGLNAPDTRLRDLCALDAPERELLVNSVNNLYHASYPDSETVVSLFEKQARSTPDNVALIYDERTWTYREINERANKFARLLRAQGVMPDDLIVVVADRCPEMVIGLLATIKAGGAYVPIDIMYPEDRIEYILEDSNPKVVLKTGDVLKFPVAAPVIDLMEEPSDQPGSDLEHSITPDNALYVIYTSGTTGRPKGCVLTHRNVVRLLRNEYFQYDFNDRDTWMMFHSFGFDFSVWEMYGALLNGGRLVVLSKDESRDTQTVMRIIREKHVTVLNQVPSAFYNLCAFDSPDNALNVRYLIFGGEALDPKRLKAWHEWHPDCHIVNMYGITETTVHVTYKDIGDDEIARGISDIGRAIPTLAVYVMNKDALCEVGVPGELCVAGLGVARGYLNRPELTREKYVLNPFGEGRMYRSGDLGRWTPDGSLQYLGRIDQQVKIHGFRVELDEIRTVLSEAEGVSDAAVVVRPDASGEQAIFAYFTAPDKLDHAALRETMAKRLPQYMLPAYMLQIDRIPVTNNGKLDRKALPNITIQSTQAFVDARDDVERALQTCFAQVLGVERIGVHDNYFEMSGDSIKAIRIISDMRELGYDLSVKDLMSNLTIERIAPYVVRSAGNAYPQEPFAGPVPPTPILRNFEELALPNPAHYNQSLVLDCAERIDMSILESALSALAKHHDMLRAVRINGAFEVLPIEKHPLFELTQADVPDDAAIIAHSNEVQASISLETGPFMKAVVYHTPNGDKLLLVIHHTVIDGVSWRILLEDLTTLYANPKASLPPKTASYAAWANALDGYAHSDAAQKQLEYWTKADAAIQPLALRPGSGARRYKTLERKLAADVTDALLHGAHKAFGTQINDILLTALAVAAYRVTGQEQISVSLEGHGREELNAPIDVTRTLGWFTDMYPVAMDGAGKLEDCLISNKERIRAVPSNGIGYFALRYLTGAALNREPDTVFNYLGDMSAGQAAGMFSRGNDDLGGENIAPENGYTFDLSISEWVSGDELRVFMAVNVARFAQDQANAFIDAYLKAIAEIVDCCMNQHETVRTASDVDMAGATEEEIGDLNDFVNGLF